VAQQSNALALAYLKVNIFESMYILQLYPLLSTEKCICQQLPDGTLFE
jgi:hypothetical protein